MFGESFLLRALLLVAALPLASAAQAQFVWTSRSSGVWSDPANWQSGHVPPTGGGPTLSLDFSNPWADLPVSRNDFGSVFGLNRLNLTTNSPTSMSVDLGAAYFTGSNPTIDFTGTGDFTLTGNGAWIGGPLEIRGSGEGTLTFGLTPTQQGGMNPVFVDLDPRQTLAVGANSKVGGMVVLNSGVLSGYLPGSGPLIVNGGQENFNTPIDADILLNADLVGPCSFTAGHTIVASNTSYGWSHASGRVNGVALYEGPTVVDSGYPNYILDIKSRGAIPRSSSYLVRGGTLGIEAAASPEAATRVNPTAPIYLECSGLSIYNTTNMPTTTYVGDISLVGRNRFAIAGPPAIVHVHSISASRIGSLYSDGGFALDEAPELVGGNHPMTPTVSIVPYAETQRGLMTYDQGQLRPLDVTYEYYHALNGNPANNARFDDPFTNNVTRTVNSLFIASSGALHGTGLIHVTSGVVLGESQFGTVIDNPLDFGARRGIVMSATPTQLRGNLHGRDGLQVTGEWALRLLGDNSDLTGELDLNGELDIPTMANFPNANPIVVSGGLLSFEQRDAISRPFDHDIILKGPLRLQGDLSIAGSISGSGGLSIVGYISLSRTNSYEGPTYFAGIVSITGDEVFGASSSISLGSSSKLALQGDWLTSRSFNAGDQSTIDSGTHRCVLSGPVTGFVTKTGSGTMTVSRNSTATFTALGGTLRLEGNVATAYAAPGGRLEPLGAINRLYVQNGGLVAPGGSGPATMHGFYVYWEGGGQMDFDLGADSDAIDLSEGLAKGSGGTHTFHFHPGPGFGPRQYVVARFKATNITPADLSYTGLPPGYSGEFVVEDHRILFVVHAA